MPRAKPKAPNARRVPFSGVRYNQAAARYIGTNGRFISPDAVRDTMDRESDAAGARMVAAGAKLKEAAQAMASGSISQDAYNEVVRSWRDAMAAEIKANHYLHAATAKGGFHEFTQADHGRLGGRLRVQYAYLSNFAAECAADPNIVLNQAPGRRSFDERVDAYSQTARNTYESFKLEADTEAGFRWEYNVLDDGAAHCRTKGRREGCPEQTALGVVRIGTLVLVGGRTCLFKCRCKVRRFKTKKAATDSLRKHRKGITDEAETVKALGACDCGHSHHEH